MPRMPRLGHAATATAHSMRAPAGSSVVQPPLPAFNRPPGRSQVPKGGGSTPRALKRTQGCLRRKLSPPATPAATDQRGGRFFVTSSRPSQPSWSPLFNEPRRRPSNAATRTSKVIWHVIARRAALMQEFGALQKTGLPDFRRQQFDCKQCVETPTTGRIGENDNRT